MADPNLFTQLEAMGLAAVKESVAKGKAGAIGSSHHNAVLGWVAIEEGKIASASAAKRDAREEETLSIARKASAAAEEANSIARLALRSVLKDRYIAIAATIIAIIAAREDIGSLIGAILVAIKP